MLINKKNTKKITDHKKTKHTKKQQIGEMGLVKELVQRDLGLVQRKLIKKIFSIGNGGRGNGFSAEIFYVNSPFYCAIISNNMCNIF